MRYPRVVYAITNTVTGKSYIGSSCRPTVRWRDHLNALRRGDHPVEEMQHDFDEYGEHLKFTILEKCERFPFNSEYRWMDVFQSCDKRYGYNYRDHHVKRWQRLGL